MKHFYLFFICLALFGVLGAQPVDSSVKVVDSSANKILLPAKSRLDQLLGDHSYLNSTDPPVALSVKTRRSFEDDVLFYLLAALVFYFGILRTAYSKYFTTLFRVFFNSSLRQSQLTDQLLQSKLPSLLFNLLFLIAGGLYVYLLFPKEMGREDIEWGKLVLCVAVFISIYTTKYLSLKLTGWLTVYQQEVNNYIFIVFLINKIVGICLLPVLVVLAFSMPSVVDVFVVASLIFVALMTALRFFRAYGFLQHKLNVSKFHFFLYIFAVEILPLVLIYKAVEVYIVKTL